MTGYRMRRVIRGKKVKPEYKVFRNPVSIRVNRSRLEKQKCITNGDKEKRAVSEEGKRRLKRVDEK